MKSLDSFKRLNVGFAITNRQQNGPICMRKRCPCNFSCIFSTLSTALNCGAESSNKCVSFQTITSCGPRRSLSTESLFFLVRNRKHNILNRSAETATDLVLDVGLLVLVQVDLVEPRPIEPHALPLAHDLGGVDLKMVHISGSACMTGIDH